MFKRILTAFFLSASCLLSFSQSVGINTDGSAPHGSAILDVKSTTKGVLLPRMTSAQKTAIVSPMAGLVIFETTTNAMWVYNGSGWVQLGAGGGGGNSAWTVNGTNIYNSNSGNVGIGLSSNLNDKLNLRGNMLITHAEGGTRARLNLQGATGTGGGTINFLKPDSSITGSIYSNNFLDRMFLQQGNNANQLVLHASGRIGINNTLPTKHLDVNGSIRSRDTISADDVITAGNDITAGNNIRATGNIRAGGSVWGDLLISSGNMVVNGTGTVSGNLQTNSNIVINNATATLQLKTTSSEKAFVQLNGDDLRVGTYATNISGKFVVRTGGGDHVFVDSAGNMGIDAPTPLSKLHIRGGSDASATSHGYLMLGPVTGSNLIFDNNEIMARNNGAAASLVLQNDGGSVRIGNAPVPNGYKFAINGKMICEELKVKLASSGWPDYVFDKKYKLPSLQQLAAFIAQNNHLPNIPSAAEVEKNGIEVGDMQKRMMEKIEELTLYILQLENKNQALNIRVANLEKINK